VCVSNYGQNQWLQLNSFGSNIASIFSFAMVGSFGNDSFRVALKFNPPSTGNNTKLQVNGFASLTSLEMQGSTSIYYAYPSVTNNTIQHIVQGTFNSANSELSVNNQTVVTGNAGGSTLNGIIIGADWAGSYPTSGKYQEVVVWGVNKSTDRGVINTALNSYYSIYPNPTSVWNLLTAVYSADTTGSSSLKTSLVASYNGESNTNDSFGTNNGTSQGGLTYVAGKIGNAFQFNGSNSYVSLPNDSLNFTGDFSVNAWFNTSTYTGYRGIASSYKVVGSLGYGWMTYHEEVTNQFALYLRDGSNHMLYRTNGGIPLNSYNMITWVRQVGQDPKIYINGVLSPGSYTFGNSSINPSYQSGQPCNLGGWNNTSYGTHKQDGTTIWSKTLTQSEINELYNSGNGAQYIGDNFYKPTTNDALGINNGTAQGGLTYGPGKIGQAFLGNSSNAYVSLPNDSFKPSGSFSINTWINLSQIGTVNAIFTSSASLSSGIRVYVYNDNKLYLDINTNYYGSITTLSANVWYQISITYDGTNYKLYINGNLDKTLTTVAPIWGSNGTNVVNIGRYFGPAGFHFNGKIDAVSTWTRSLTASEITELYNSGNGKQYPF
jgi:hypothetical protein